MRRKERTLTTALQPEGAIERVPHPTAERRQISADEILKIVLDTLDDSKAEDVISINISGKSALADHMVVATGRSHRHVASIAEHVSRDLSLAGHRVASIEGTPHCDWVLVDASDVIVHIFRPEVRSFYNLEKMWSADPPMALASRPGSEPVEV